MLYRIRCCSLHKLVRKHLAFLNDITFCRGCSSFASVMEFKR